MNKTGEEVVALLKEGPLGLCRTLDLMLSMMGSLGMAEGREKSRARFIFWASSSGCCVEDRCWGPEQKRNKVHRPGL